MHENGRGVSIVFVLFTHYVGCLGVMEPKESRYLKAPNDYLGFLPVFIIKRKFRQRSALTIVVLAV